MKTTIFWWIVGIVFLATFNKNDPADKVFLVVFFIMLVGGGMKKVWDRFDKDGKIMDAARDKAEEKVKASRWWW